MTNVKYSLCPKDRRSAIGVSDLRKSGGTLIDTRGCLVLLVVSGYAVATINFRKCPLRQGCVAILFYSDVFHLNEISAGFSVRFVSLSYEDVEDTIYKIPSVNLWDALYENPVYRAPKEEWELLLAWWRQMEWIDGNGSGARNNELLRCCYYTFLLSVDGFIADRPSLPLHSKHSRGWKIVVDFYKLLPKHCRRTRDVRFYADELCISTTYLYKVCRKILHSSPKVEIDKQTVSEIKSYLANTDLPVKRIAEELRFEDTSYMCRFFRRQTGLSPIDYRNSLVRL